MATEARRQRLSANRRAVRDDLEELNSQERQDEILHPKAVSVDLGGSKLELYPLSGYAVRSFMALAQQVFAGAAGGAAVSSSLRVSGVLVQSYLRPFLGIAAEATAPAGAITAEQVQEVAEELDVRSQSARGALELASVFDAMCRQNGVTEALTDFFGDAASLRTPKKTK